MISPRRSRLEKEVEEKLRPSQAAIEREARARVQKEATGWAWGGTWRNQPPVNQKDVENHWKSPVSVGKSWVNHMKSSRNGGYCPHLYSPQGIPKWPTFSGEWFCNLFGWLLGGWKLQHAARRLRKDSERYWYCMILSYSSNMKERPRGNWWKVGSSMFHVFSWGVGALIPGPFGSSSR